jgi:PelA/Pel-15E family pectate lyase
MLRFPLSVVCLLASVLGLHAEVRWPDALKQSDAWYASPEAGIVATAVLRYQTPEGGWPKNTDLTLPPKPGEHASATIDNKATTEPMEFIARVLTASAKPDSTLRAAFDRGLDYLFAAQYPSGGWPQFFPLKKGYYTHITYNDDAMTRVLVLLKKTADGTAPYAFVDKDRRARAAAAVTKGIDCILKTQVRQNDTLTVWCAQHDEHTFAPAWARKYEPPSLSGGESVGVVRFLMSVEKPAPAIIDSVNAAVAWFEKTKITGQRYEFFKNDAGEKDRHITPDKAAPPLWARFYELGTDKPIFLGRDSEFHYSLTDIERERRTGYAFYGTWAAALLEKDYPAWKKRLGLH